jgi:hypothetical protein
MKEIRRYLPIRISDLKPSAVKVIGNQGDNVNIFAGWSK